MEGTPRELENTLCDECFLHHSMFGKALSAHPDCALVGLTLDFRHIHNNQTKFARNAVSKAKNCSMEGTPRHE